MLHIWFLRDYATEAIESSLQHNVKKVIVLQALLNALIDMHQYKKNDQYGYHFERSTEGYNGVVYRVTATDGQSFAAKIIRKTQRQRSVREWQTTDLLHRVGLDVSPKPYQLFEDVAAFQADVLVSSWIDGDLLKMPPSPENQSQWLAILKTLAQVHALKADKLSDAIMPAATPLKNPQDMLAIIQQRLAGLQPTVSGHLAYDQVMAVVDALQKQVPSYWHNSAPQTLVHGDCHTANMLQKDSKIYLVDWENAGIADPALDISNMTTLWRFFDLPEAHHQWLINTYGNILGDSWLVDRIQVYRKIQVVHWVVNYSRFIQARQADTNPNRVHRFSLDFQLKWQKIYYQRACEWLNIA